MRSRLMELKDKASADAAQVEESKRNFLLSVLDRLGIEVEEFSDSLSWSDGGIHVQAVISLSNRSVLLSFRSDRVRTDHRCAGQIGCACGDLAWYTRRVLVYLDVDGTVRHKPDVEKEIGEALLDIHKRVKEFESRPSPILERLRIALGDFF